MVDDKSISKKLVFAGLYLLGATFYSYTSRGAEGVVIAIIDVYYLISPYLYFNYVSLTKIKPKTEESRIEEYATFR